MSDVIPEAHRDLLDANGFAHLASLGSQGEQLGRVTLVIEPEHAAAMG